ncbi:MAG: hypothetical protein WKG06_47815 [Segetibacter sp.]
MDAYLTNPAFYPVGTFDETHDGIGNPVKNVPLFRQDLAAPFGTSGQNALLENISNSSYTANLDMTTLATPEGRQFLFLRAGDAGVKIHENYKQILEETGVTGYPFVQAKLVGDAGNPNHAVGRRVDDQKLKDMTAYLFSLPAPAGAKSILKWLPVDGHCSGQTAPVATMWIKANRLMQSCLILNQFGRLIIQVLQVYVEIQNKVPSLIRPEILMIKW